MRPSGRLSVTKNEAATDAGRELLALVRGIVADGRLADEEALDLIAAFLGHRSEATTRKVPTLA